MAVLMPHSIFIHIPKTGGTWVRAVLPAAGIKCREVGPPGGTNIQVIHCSVRGLPQHLRKKRLIFSCIRHPVAWLKSRWSYAIERGKLKVKKKRGWLENSLNEDLNVFIERALERNPSAPARAMMHPIGWQYIDGIWQDTLKKKDRAIGRTETIREDLMDFLRKAGEKFNPIVIEEFAPRRVSGKKSKQRVSKELAQRVCDANQVLMELGHYGTDY